MPIQNSALVAEHSSEVGDAFLVRLKNDTASAHRAIERQGLLADMFSDAFDLAMYQQILIAMYGFYEPVERELERFHDEFPVPARQSRSGHIASDLRGLGLSARQIREIPRCSVLPETNDLFKAYGVCYVFEGANLGGRVICKHLEKTLAAGLHGCDRFYAGNAKNTGPCWSIFRDALADLAERNIDQHDVMVDAAEQTFATLNKWLDR